MPVAIPNYKFSYRRKGRAIFVPTTIGRKIGNEIREAVQEFYTFSPMHFHMGAGGHVAALHHHRGSAYFARLDIARFFYSISRRRVQSVLDRIGAPNARFYAKWSTVRNPYVEPRYVLPYGFVQSPILSSLVLATSCIGEYLGNLPDGIKVSIYVDDVMLSGDNKEALEQVFDETISLLERDGFELNQEKIRSPALSIDIFNCDISTGRTVVREDRIVQFLAGLPPPLSEAAFIAYRASVEAGNEA